jgi:CDGSH-type Zn-finger protein
MSIVEINIVKDGPILIKGKTNVTKDGEKLELTENYALCRCGYTNNKPMCDGSHTTCDFKG